MSGSCKKLMIICIYIDGSGAGSNPLDWGWRRSQPGYPYSAHRAAEASDTCSGSGLFLTIHSSFLSDENKRQSWGWLAVYVILTHSLSFSLHYLFRPPHVSIYLFIKREEDIPTGLDLNSLCESRKGNGLYPRCLVDLVPGTLSTLWFTFLVIYLSSAASKTHQTMTKPRKSFLMGDYIKEYSRIIGGDL